MLGVILAVMSTLILLSSPLEVEAIPVVATSGSIAMDTTTPVPFDDVRVDLQGDNFVLSNEFLRDSFRFTTSPHPARGLHDAGTLLEFDGTAHLIAPGNVLMLDGISYRASGSLQVDTGAALVETTVTTPFTLTGTVLGERLDGPGMVSVEVSGAGVMTAQFLQFPTGDFSLRSIRYDVMPDPTIIPESPTMALLSMGVLTFALGAPMLQASKAGHSRNRRHQ